MRIHSNILQLDDLTAARRAAGNGVLFLDVDDYSKYGQPTVVGSRSRARAFDVRLCSDGTPDVDGTSRRRAVNAGTSRWIDRSAGLPKAASYADWGRFLAHLFDVDPDAIAGLYKGADDFHEKTGYAFS